MNTLCVILGIINLGLFLESISEKKPVVFCLIAGSVSFSVGLLGGWK